MASHSSSTESLPRIDSHGLMDVRESPSGISSSQLKKSNGGGGSRTQLLVARPSTSSGFVEQSRGGRSVRPNSPTIANRQWMHEIAEQVRSLRNEVAKKDELVSKLRSENMLLQSRLRADEDKFTVDGLCSQLLQHVRQAAAGSGESPPRDNHPQYIVERVAAVVEDRKILLAQVSQLRGKAETASSDLAAEKVRADSLDADLKQTKRRYQEQEQKADATKSEMEKHQQNLARQTALVQNLRQQVQELESKLSNQTSALSEHSVSASALKRETETCKRRTAELEEQLRIQIEAVQQSEQRAAQTSEKYQSLCGSLGTLLDIEGVGLMSPLDDMLVAKVTSLMHENDELKTEMASVRASVDASETDARAGRETIMRLVAEVGKEQKAAASCQEQVRKIKLEKDTATQLNTRLQQELENTKEQLSALQSHWNRLKVEAETKDAKLQSLDVQLEATRLSAAGAETKYSEMCRQLSDMLNSFGFDVNGHESGIFGKIQEVLIENKNSKPMRETLEHQIGLLTQQVTEHERITSSTSDQAVQLESQLGSRDEQITALEKEIIAVDTYKDTLKKEAEDHKDFVARLCQTLQLDHLTASIGLEINSETILTRAELLVKQETEALSEKSTTVYGLQRKVKAMKKELESRELQLSLLHRKLMSQDEKLVRSYEREKEEERAIDRAKKMQKQLERASRHINEQKSALTEMKAQLHDVDEYRIQCTEQTTRLKRLETTVEELSTAKGRLTKQLSAAQRKLEKSAGESRENADQQQKAITSLNEDLATTRLALAESKEREQQLLQFRNALAKTLGVDADASSMADYEIVARVERVVEAGNAHLATSRSLESSLLQLGNSFQTSYESALSLVSPRKQRNGDALAEIRELPANFGMKPV